MIERDLIVLTCDHEDHAFGTVPRFGAGGTRVYFRGDEVLLRAHAREAGWSGMRFPGAPWHRYDYCPEHA